MTAADDVNLDDLKRRARRRLVGAIVLALVVAVVVPMLLESDPKPLGEDVAVKIPPVDDGKFVNRLADKGKADPGKTDSAKAPATKAEPRSEAKVEPTRPEPKAEAAKAEGVAAPKSAEPAEAAKAEPAKMDAPRAEASKAEPAKTEAAAAATPKAPAANGAANGATPGGDFAVQVYAFSDAYGANSLVGKLKRAGYPAYSEQASTSKGTLWRVRIGPYASRESAAAARDKLKGEGYNGIVAAAK